MKLYLYNCIIINEQLNRNQLTRLFVMNLNDERNNNIIDIHYNNYIHIVRYRILNVCKRAYVLFLYYSNLYYSVYYLFVYGKYYQVKLSVFLVVLSESIHYTILHITCRLFFLFFLCLLNCISYNSKMMLNFNSMVSW